MAGFWTRAIIFLKWLIFPFVPFCFFFVFLYGKFFKQFADYDQKIEKGKIFSDIPLLTENAT